MAEADRQMTTQQINSLRKSGKLDEALGHARLLHAGDANDPWIVRTLFWCLHDEVKRVRSANDPAAIAAVIREVELLNLPNEDTDQPMHDCAARILGTDPVAKATLLSKAGKHRESVDLLRPIARAEGARQHEIEAYGWVLFRKIRDCAEDEQRAAVWCLNEFLNCWSIDRNPNPMLFKNIFIQAKLHAESWTGVIALIEKLGLYRLKPEDFADETLDSDFAPFQDQLLGAVHKCLKKHPLMRENQSVIHKWLGAWKDSFGGDEWPQYHLGHILLWTGGDLSRAKALLLKTVQRNPKDYWRWEAFAEALQGDEAKAALSRGILCSCEDESYKVPLYKEYAELLAAEGELPAAKASLEEAMRLRRLTGNEWTAPIPLWLEQVSAVAGLDIHAYAASFVEEADDLLASDLPDCRCVLIRPLQKENRFLYYCVAVGTRNLKFPQDHLPPLEVEAIDAKFMDQPEGVCKVLTWQAAPLPDGIIEREIAVVTHINADKQFTAIATANQDFRRLFFDHWPGASSLTPGNCLELRSLTDNEGKVTLLSWTKVATTPIPDRLIPVHGIFQLAPGKPFGFVEMADKRIFVAPNEAQALVDSCEVHGWAIRSQDKQGRLTWKLLSLPSHCP
jgi:tetratricopeptide (TPR) repeat protein